MLKPKINKNIAPGTTGLKYIFEKSFLIESDEYQGADNIKMRFVFNGVDYICPFYPERIASIIRDGRPYSERYKKNLQRLDRHNDENGAQVRASIQV